LSETQGYCFNPDDDLDFREKLARLASEEALRQRLQETGRARAAQFTWSRTAEATLRLYRQLAK
jgi:glycosyltransferase involved in cell wall biosynthesis